MCDNENVFFRAMDKNAIAPARHSDGAAGYDICAAKDGIIAPESVGLVSTAISLKLPKGLIGLIMGRSGLTWKNGLIIEITPVYNDQEIVIPIRNTTDVPFEYKAGCRIAQMIFAKTVDLNIQVE